MENNLNLMRKNTMLKVFELTPKQENENGRNWKGSTYKGKAFICAESESEARKLAEKKFFDFADITQETCPEPENVYSPWLAEDYVSCVEIKPTKKHALGIINPILYEEGLVCDPRYQYANDIQV